MNPGAAVAHVGHHPLMAVMGAALLGACAAAGNGPQSQDRTRAVFANETDESAILYVLIPAGGVIRMGTVMPGRTDTLRVPWLAVDRGHVEFLARLRMRGVEQTSGPVAISSGDWLSLRLHHDARMLVVLPQERPGGLLRD